MTAFPLQLKLHRHLKPALAASALAAAAALPAQADTTRFVPLVLGSGTTQSAAISDTVGYIGNFTDDFVFTSPPPLAMASFAGTAGIGLTFSSVTLLTYGTSTLNPISGSFSATAFNESATAPISSAVYVLEIKGFSASATAAYSGTISASPVPEPPSWALMAAGLLGSAALVSRRRG